MLRFNLLYTKHKHQKSKTWHDGSGKFDPANGKISVFDGNGKHIDSSFLGPHATVSSGQEFQTDYYLVSVENLASASDAAPSSKPVAEKRKTADTTVPAGHPKKRSSQ